MSLKTAKTVVWLGLLVIGFAAVASIFWRLFGRCPACGCFLGKSNGKYCPHCGAEIPW